jgi:hypothetical protein
VIIGWRVVPTHTFLESHFKYSLRVLDDERFDPPLRERCITRILDLYNVQKLAKKMSSPLNQVLLIVLR